MDDKFMYLGYMHHGFNTHESYTHAFNLMRHYMHHCIIDTSTMGEAVHREVLDNFVWVTRVTWSFSAVGTKDDAKQAQTLKSSQLEVRA